MGGVCVWEGGGLLTFQSVSKVNLSLEDFGGDIITKLDFIHHVLNLYTVHTGTQYTQYTQAHRHTVHTGTQYTQYTQAHSTHRHTGTGLLVSPVLLKDNNPQLS